MHQAQSLVRKESRINFFLHSHAYGWCVEQVLLQRPQIFLWIPVFLSFGIGAYFSLSIEPPLLFGVLWALLMVSIYFLFFRARSNLTLIFCAIFLVFSGFVAAQVRTNLVYTPILEKKMSTVEIIGTVLSVEDGEDGKGQKVIIGDMQIEDLAQEQTPRNVRLSYRAKPELIVGQRIKALANLTPPATPVMPDAFDFRRYMFFQSIGAVGFIFNAPEILEQKSSGILIAIENLRQVIVERVKAAVPEREAALIIALTIGKQGGISQDDRDAMRDAGLSHILAISGMNFSLMAGTVFFALRLGMAAIPRIALNYPIKKISAVAAFIIVILYFLISGMSIPAQRSVLSTGAVFLAIFLDRSPISLRLVAFAAIIVLIIAPESLLSASFHMSFAAVVALIAVYDSTRSYWEKLIKRGGFLNHIALYFVGVCATTIIGSFATGIYALYHFQRFAVLGLIANFVAVPLIAFIIMPFSLVAILLAPFGMDWIAYRVMGFAAIEILDVAHWVAKMPLASWKISAWPFSTLVFFTLAGVWVVLWRDFGKVLAVPLFVCGVVAIFMSQKPIALASASHKIFGFYDGAESLYVNSTRTDKFTRENWERALGLPEDGSIFMVQSAADNLPYHCDSEACRVDVQGIKFSLVKDVYVLAQECEWADSLIVEDSVESRPKNCGDKIIIDRFDTWRDGAYGFYKTENGQVFVRNVAQTLGDRPWTNKKHEHK